MSLSKIACLGRTQLLCRRGLKPRLQSACLIFLLLGAVGLAANAELVGYWSFDEADGVDDLSGNGNDGIIHGKPKAGNDAVHITN